MVSLATAQEMMVRRGKIVEDIIAMEKPQLIPLFLTYQNEALAARKFLECSLSGLEPGVEILEVGGGILALAIQLASEGFKITTVEPVGDGFSNITYMMRIFSEIARKQQLQFELIESPIEKCVFDRKFDFVFSINVMEHLEDPYSVLLQIVQNLNRGGSYRFFCPNYDFPYEPHFGKWLYLRKDEAFYLQKIRANSLRISALDSSGLYGSLNYVTLKKICAFSDNHFIRIESNPNAFFNLLKRLIDDQELQQRHGRLSLIVNFLSVLKLHFLAKLIPRKYQPVMDVKAFY